MQFTWEVIRSGTLTVVKLGGEIDLAVSDEVLDALTTAALVDPATDRVVVDLAELTLIDSIGIHALVAAQRVARQRGVGMSFTNPRGMVERVMEITGVLKILTNPPTVWS